MMANPARPPADQKILRLPDMAGELYARVMKNREALVEAWLAETGVLPSEAVICEQRCPGGVRVWVGRKGESSSVCAPADEPVRRER